MEIAEIEKLLEQLSKREVSIENTDTDIGSQASSMRCSRYMMTPELQERLVKTVGIEFGLNVTSSIGYISAITVYENGGYIGWHTDSDRPGTRYVLSYSYGVGNKFYGNDEAYEDVVGWNKREFYTSEETPYRHKVECESKRLAIVLCVPDNTVRG